MLIIGNLQSIEKLVTKSLIPSRFCLINEIVPVASLQQAKGEFEFLYSIFQLKFYIIYVVNFYPNKNYIYENQKEIGYHLLEESSI